MAAMLPDAGSELKFFSVLRQTGWKDSDFEFRFYAKKGGLYTVTATFFMKIAKPFYFSVSPPFTYLFRIAIDAADSFEPPRGRKPDADVSLPTRSMIDEILLLVTE